MYIDETMNYTVIESTSNGAFQALWIELQFAKQSNIICGVIYKQHNSAERFLDCFDEAVDRYSATGEPICLLGDVNIFFVLKLVIMLNNFLIAYRAMPFFKQLINRQECAKVQQHLSTILLQIRSANTLPVGTLFLTSLITFPNSASFNLLLKQLSLSKLLFEILKIL